KLFAEVLISFPPSRPSQFTIPCAATRVSRTCCAASDWPNKPTHPSSHVTTLHSMNEPYWWRSSQHLCDECRIEGLSLVRLCVQPGGALESYGGRPGAPGALRRAGR